MDDAWGWFGKLPTLGDFATRRLPAAFVEPWDQWLALGLASWREHDAGWLDAYLAGPIWCFELGAGLLGRGSARWSGVLMPSVDRVGRYFPLTIAAPTAAESNLARRLHRLQHTAGVAARAMHEDWSAADLDAALARLNDLTLPPPGRYDDSALAASLVQSAPAGHSLWWQPDSDAAPRQHNGLPTRHDFSRLLGGSAPTD